MPFTASGRRAPRARQQSPSLPAVQRSRCASTAILAILDDGAINNEQIADAVEPKKGGVGSRILMGLIGLLMSLVIAALSFYHKFGQIDQADLTSPDFVPVRDSMETLSALLALVIVLALVTIICSILTFIGLGFSKKALLGSSTIMLVVLLVCVWMEWSIIQTLFGDSPENTTNWRMNLLTMPPTLFAYCNLAGLAVMALIARLSRAKRESSLKLEVPF